MSLVLLWILLGAASGYGAHRIKQKLDPDNDRESKKSDLWLHTTVGMMAGPLMTAMLPVRAYESWRDGRMLLGPGARDSLPQCLKLRDAIRGEMASVEYRMRRKRALLAGVQRLIDSDFSPDTATEAGINPNSPEMPSQEKIEETCRGYERLQDRYRELEAGLELTEAQIDSIKYLMGATIESSDLGTEQLEPRPELLLPEPLDDDGETPLEEPEDDEGPQQPNPAARPADLYYDAQQRQRLRNQLSTRDPVTEYMEELDGEMASDRPTREEELLALLGTPSLQLSRHLLKKAATPLNITRGSWDCTCLAGLLDGPYYRMGPRAFSRKGRAWTAEWVMAEYNDGRLALAIADATCPAAVSEMVRFRLEQAMAIVESWSPPD